jgi:hypothetical protein
MGGDVRRFTLGGASSAVCGDGVRDSGTRRRATPDKGGARRRAGTRLRNLGRGADWGADRGGRRGAAASAHVASPSARAAGMSRRYCRRHGAQNIVRTEGHYGAHKAGNPRRRAGAMAGIMADIATSGRGVRTGGEQAADRRGVGVPRVIGRVAAPAAAALAPAAVPAGPVAHPVSDNFCAAAAAAAAATVGYGGTRALSHVTSTRARWAARRTTCVAAPHRASARGGHTTLTRAHAVTLRPCPRRRVRGGA